MNETWPRSCGTRNSLRGNIDNGLAQKFSRMGLMPRLSFWGASSVALGKVWILGSTEHRSLNCPLPFLNLNIMISGVFAGVFIMCCYISSIPWLLLVSLFKISSLDLSMSFHDQKQKYKNSSTAIIKENH